MSQSPFFFSLSTLSYNAIFYVFSLLLFFLETNFSSIKLHNSRTQTAIHSAPVPTSAHKLWHSAFYMCVCVCVLSNRFVMDFRTQIIICIKSFTFLYHFKDKKKWEENTCLHKVWMLMWTSKTNIISITTNALPKICIYKNVMLHEMKKKKSQSISFS